VFMEWKERLYFSNKPPSLATWKSSFKASISSYFVRIKQNLHESIVLWLDALQLFSFLRCWSFCLGLLLIFLSPLPLPLVMLVLLWVGDGGAFDYKVKFMADP
jgi:hypothetical protein